MEDKRSKKRLGRPTSRALHKSDRLASRSNSAQSRELATTAEFRESNATASIILGRPKHAWMSTSGSVGSVHHVDTMGYDPPLQDGRSGNAEVMQRVNSNNTEGSQHQIRHGNNTKHTSLDTDQVSDYVPHQDVRDVRRWQTSGTKHLSVSSTQRLRPPRKSLRASTHALATSNENVVESTRQGKETATDVTPIGVNDANQLSEALLTVDRWPATLSFIEAIRLLAEDLQSNHPSSHAENNLVGQAPKSDVPEHERSVSISHSVISNIPEDNTADAPVNDDSPPQATPVVDRVLTTSKSPPFKSLHTKPATTEKFPCEANNPALPICEPLESVQTNGRTTDAETPNGSLHQNPELRKPQFNVQGLNIDDTMNLGGQAPSTRPTTNVSVMENTIEIILPPPDVADIQSTDARPVNAQTLSSGTSSNTPSVPGDLTSVECSLMTSSQSNPEQNESDTLSPVSALSPHVKRLDPKQNLGSILDTAACLTTINEFIAQFGPQSPHGQLTLIESYRLDLIRAAVITGDDIFVRLHCLFCRFRGHGMTGANDLSVPHYQVPIMDFLEATIHSNSMISPRVLSFFATPYSTLNEAVDAEFANFDQRFGQQLHDFAIHGASMLDQYITDHVRLRSMPFVSTMKAALGISSRILQIALFHKIHARSWNLENTFTSDHASSKAVELFLIHQFEWDRISYLEQNDLVTCSDWHIYYGCYRNCYTSLYELYSSRKTDVRFQIWPYLRTSTNESLVVYLTRLSQAKGPIQDSDIRVEASGPETSRSVPATSDEIAVRPIQSLRSNEQGSFPAMQTSEQHAQPVQRNGSLPYSIDQQTRPSERHVDLPRTDSLAQIVVAPTSSIEPVTCKNQSSDWCQLSKNSLTVSTKHHPASEAATYESLPLTGVPQSPKGNIAITTRPQKLPVSRTPFETAMLMSIFVRPPRNNILFPPVDITLPTQHRSHPDQSLLHLADSRIPYLRSKFRPDGAEIESYLQQVTELSVGPIRIDKPDTPHSVPFKKVLFNISKTTHDKIPKDIKDSHYLGSRSTRVVTPISLQYRLRACKINKTASNANLNIRQWTTTATSWPEQLALEFNGQSLTVKREPAFARSEACDLTPNILSGENELKISINQDVGVNWPDDHCFFVEQVAITTSQDIIKAIDDSSNSLTIPPFLKCRYNWTPVFWENFNHGIAVRNFNQTVSLIDPLRRIQIPGTPVQGVTCRHAEAFDLVTFLQSRPKQHHKPGGVCDVDSWSCPICNGDARPSELCKNGLLAQILAKLRSVVGGEKVCNVNVRTDRTWTAIVDGKELVGNIDIGAASNTVGPESSKGSDMSRKRTRAGNDDDSDDGNDASARKRACVPAP